MSGRLGVRLSDKRTLLGDSGVWALAAFHWAEVAVWAAVGPWLKAPICNLCVCNKTVGPCRANFGVLGREGRGTWRRCYGFSAGGWGSRSQT